jgi:hypothetical protein
VTIERNAGKALLEHGQTAPEPRSGLALIDTGASHTCIDVELATDRGLPVVDIASSSAATHAQHQRNGYPGEITLPTTALNSAGTLGASLVPQGLIVSIGRGARQCRLFLCHGTVGQITLSL